jgi:protein SCO1/2
VLLLAGCGSSETAPKGPPGQKLEDATPIPDFALRDAQGRVVKLSDTRGRPVLVTFLYTECPDVCPLIAEELNAVLKDAPDARVLAISVDPRGDTPHAVRVYERRHRLVDRFSYLVGTHDELAPVWQRFNVLVEPHQHVRVDHAAMVYLLDEEGRSRIVYPPDVRADTILNDLRHL